MGSPYVIDYEGSFLLELAPEAVWDAITHTERFEDWWAWLRELRTSGDGLAGGTVLHGVVVPPLPYRMELDIELVTCIPPASIDAAVHGDLEGQARLELSPAGQGTAATVRWSIEMRQMPMRIAARFAYPLLKWGHDRVVEATIDGFRRHVEGPGAAR